MYKKTRPQRSHVQTGSSRYFNQLIYISHYRHHREASAWRASAMTTGSSAGTSVTTRAVRTTRTVSHLTARLLVAEEIETIDHVQHGIIVDCVILHIAALHGVDGAAEVALVVQDVVELNHHRQRLTLEEALRYLRVPYKLVCVQRLVVISAAAVLMQIRRKICAPRTCHVERGTVCELPCVEVALCLQFVAHMVVPERTISSSSSHSLR